MTAIDPPPEAYWLALAQAGIGGETTRLLLNRFNRLDEAFLAPDAEWFAAAPTLHRPALARLRANWPVQTLAELARMNAAAVALVTWDDGRYPLQLHEITSAPPALFVQGDLAALSAPGAALVGTRRPPLWARRLAGELGREMAGRGLTVFGGLAYGVDAAAHQGALLAAGGRTVAVLGGGHGRLYPAGHRTLAAAVAGRGAVVGELPPSQSVTPQSLAARNRLISALSRAVIVVAARPESGSRHAVHFARQQGRPVLAVPGTPGCDELLASGAADPLEPPVDYERLAKFILTFSH